MTGLPLGRRTALQLGGLAVLALAGCDSPVAGTKTVLARVTSAGDALAQLNAGNDRFASGRPAHPDQGSARRTSEVASQSPFALIVSCVDSRVPPEIVFDQGLGNLFVTRTAGQVLDDAVIGSIQYGVAVLGTPLIVVLGHQDCGAITSTVAAVQGKAKPTGTDIDRIVDAIAPAVLRAQNEHAGDLVLASTKFNVDNVVEQLRANSALAGAQAQGAVRITGGYYDIGTGRVAIAG